jgi:hypothetical protein
MENLTKALIINLKRTEKNQAGTIHLLPFLLNFFVTQPITSCKSLRFLPNFIWAYPILSMIFFSDKESITLAFASIDVHCQFIKKFINQDDRCGCCVSSSAPLRLKLWAIRVRDLVWQQVGTSSPLIIRFHATPCDVQTLTEHRIVYPKIFKKEKKGWILLCEDW